MASILDKKFAKIWKELKKDAGIKSSAWFKKADAAVSAKVEAYQKALAKAQSGMVEDLLKVGKALTALDEAFVKFVDAKKLVEVGDKDAKKTEKENLLAEINRLKIEVQHERTLFETRLSSALSAADHDIKKLESLEAVKKKELWKGFGIDL